MAPNEVYVIYDQANDTIHSVHSFREFALMERDKILTDATRIGRPVPYLRYAITTLEQALEWMYETDYEDKGVKVFNKIELN